MPIAATQVLRIFLPDAPPGGLARLLAGVADGRLTPIGIEIPLAGQAPEEILSLCLRFGVTARATRIVTKPSSG